MSWTIRNSRCLTGWSVDSPTSQIVDCWFRGRGWELTINVGWTVLYGMVAPIAGDPVTAQVTQVPLLFDPAFLLSRGHPRIDKECNNTIIHAYLMDSKFILPRVAVFHS